MLRTSDHNLEIRRLLKLLARFVVATEPDYRTPTSMHQCDHINHNVFTIWCNIARLRGSEASDKTITMGSWQD